MSRQRQLLTLLSKSGDGSIVTLPVQTLGSNLYVDGDMEAAGTAVWTNAGGASTLSKQTTNPYEGTQLMRAVRNNPTGASAVIQDVGSNGSYYEISGAVRSDGTALPIAGEIETGIFIYFGTNDTAWQLYRGVLRRTTRHGFGTFAAAAGTYVEADNLEYRLITLNTQLTAPSANMQITQHYTLPASPRAADTVWLMPRISDFTAGNYWLAWLRYTGSQWDINLYSVATHTRTSRIAATNIGSTNGIRVNVLGDNWALQTTTDGGETWTTRGTHTNSLYNTATGYNSIWSSGFTIGNLVYKAAT